MALVLQGLSIVLLFFGLAASLPGPGLQAGQLLLEMAQLALVAGGLGRLDLGLVLLDVLVDGVHAGAGLGEPVLIGPTIRVLRVVAQRTVMGC